MFFLHSKADNFKELVTLLGHEKVGFVMEIFVTSTVRKCNKSNLAPRAYNERCQFTRVAFVVALVKNFTIIEIFDITHEL